ncbi:MAG: hypothetical protein H0W72_13235 [Planctomycetes bacterium]|nr:hypothetical protein [Planctomycetota bacterium]
MVTAAFALDADADADADADVDSTLVQDSPRLLVELQRLRHDLGRERLQREADRGIHARQLAAALAAHAATRHQLGLAVEQINASVRRIVVLESQRSLLVVAAGFAGIAALLRRR